MRTAGESRVVVRGVEDGTEVFAGRLTHGYAPRRLMREAGYKAGDLLGFATRDDGTIVISYEVATLRTARRPKPMPPVRDGGVVRQRVAAYSVITSERGILLAQLSRATGRPGLWILPGGGVDEGESPDVAAVREAWEEAGQHIVTTGLFDVSSSHRFGPGRTGVLENFHAVRLLFTATCPNPTDPVLHDVGGSTECAAWFDPADVVDPLAPGYPPGGMAPWSLDAVRRSSGNIRD